MTSYIEGCSTNSARALPRHRGHTNSKAMKTANLPVEIEEGSASAQQQLFSFPKPPTQESSSSPLFHLRMDTDSRKGSYRFETPPLTAESSPSFGTFLQRRPSTSVSITDVTAESSKTLMATSPGHPQPTLYPLGTPLTQLGTDTKDGLKSDRSTPSQMQEPEDSFETTKPAHVQVPVPKALSARVVPLFLFLRNDEPSEVIAVEGILEWIGYWVNHGVRVRTLAEDLNIVKAEVSSQCNWTSTEPQRPSWFS